MIVMLGADPGLLAADRAGESEHFDEHAPGDALAAHIGAHADPEVGNVAVVVRAPDGEQAPPDDLVALPGVPAPRIDIGRDVAHIFNSAFQLFGRVVREGFGFQDVV